MTTIEYGGGPTIEQRRAFAGLKDDGMVPGYGGHCPQLKFDYGKTYGYNTYELAQNRKSKRPITVSMYEPAVTSKLQLENNVPESTGDNKYTQNMVPGYTGYIPRWPFKFGNTYKEECDVCLDEHISDLKRQSAKEDNMRQSFRSFPRLQPIRSDPEVKDHLNTFSDELAKKSQLITDRKAPEEPPIPGYKGYVPRIYTTELGLGCRYHDMTANGLESFYSDMERRFGNRGGGSATSRAEGSAQRESGKLLSASVDNLEDSDKRLYKKDGMIPKYTGYLPQNMYTFGYSYGDTSRSLDVCNHNQACYGDYVKTFQQSPYFD